MIRRAKSRIARALTLQTGLVSAALAVAACSSSQPQSAAAMQSERSQTVARLDQSTELVNQFRSQIPNDVAGGAECVLVVPDLKQGGLVVGGVGGKGFASCRSASSTTGWSAPAPIKMGGGTLGAQIGFQSGDVLALMTTDRAAKALESGNFKIGVDASASAGPVGAGRSRSGDVTVKSDVMSYSRSSGLFAGATLNGMTVNQDDDAIQALYGSPLSLRAILEGADVAMPPAAQRFVAAVGGSFGPGAVSLRSSR